MTRNIDEFILGYPQEAQEILAKIRSIIREEAPEAVEAIVYGIPTFKLNGKNLVHFSAFKHHIGFYPTPSAIIAFKDELSKYNGAKGSVQFPLDKPIPYDLVRKIAQFRVNEVLEKVRKKK